MPKWLSRRPAELGEEGNGIVNPDQFRRLCRWRNTVGISSVMQHPKNTPLTNGYSCEFDPPCLDEACTTFRKLQNDRAPGDDGIPLEIYKACVGNLGAWLHRVSSKPWYSESYPTKWNSAVLLPLFEIC